MVIIAEIAVAPAIVRRSSRSCSRRRGRYMRAPQRSAIVSGGNKRNHVSGNWEAPTARPPSRSTKTASVRIAASAIGAKVHHLTTDRVLVSGARTPARAEKVVRSEDDISRLQAAARSPLVLGRPLRCAPKRCARNHQHCAADDEQCQVEPREGQAALLSGCPAALLLHVAA